MKRVTGMIRKILAMRWEERALLGRALFAVISCRVALYVLPKSPIQRLSARPDPRSPNPAQFAPERLAWAVQTAARRVPGATCLTQALALHRLLGKAGHAAEIRIGVAKGERGRLDSHAWVVCRGRVLVGDGGDLGRYEPILSLGGEHP